MYEAIFLTVLKQSQNKSSIKQCQLLKEEEEEEEEEEEGGGGEGEGEKVFSLSFLAAEMRNEHQDAKNLPA